MKIKTFRGATYEEALSRAKKTLGRDIILIHTQKRKVGGFLGFFQKVEVELTVGSGIDVAQKGTAKSAPATGSSTPPLAQEVRRLSGDISELKKLMEQRDQLQPFSDMTDTLFRIYEYLVSIEMEEDLAYSIINKVQGKLRGDERENLSRIMEILKSVVSSYIPVAGPINIAEGNGKTAQVVILIGSTGVGKTTSLAKLAANYTLRCSKKVAFITADTYRISAVDQLKTFGNIVQIPVEVVVTPRDFELAIKKHRSKDLILVDTAGRSPYNELQISELKQFIAVAGEAEVHLVLSATTKYKDILNVIDCYEKVGFDRLFLTKLDETSCLGGLINVLNTVDKPVSYITTGQNVPDDIELAKADELSDFILKELNGLNEA